MPPFRPRPGHARLVGYAVCAFAVVWFRNWPPRRLRALGVGVLAVASAISVVMGVTFPSWPAEAQAAFVADSWNPPEAEITAQIAAYRGGWVAQMEKRVPSAFAFQTLFLLMWGFWRASGMMLIGMGLYRLGVFSAEREDRTYMGMIAGGTLVGLPLIALGIYWNFQNNWAPTSFFFGTQFNYWGSSLVALGWVGAVMLLYRRGALGWLQARLAAVGQTAFSNYILQSVICTTIFYGHGLGLFAQVERTGQIAIVLAIWVFQLAVSPLWLQRFRFGPLEWLWRSLTYGTRQPIRRTGAKPSGTRFDWDKLSNAIRAL